MAAEKTVDAFTAAALRESRAPAAGVLLAIDPGTNESGWALIDIATRRPISFGKTENNEFRRILQNDEQFRRLRVVAIEMIAAYGMAVGQEVFETCVWIGRFMEVLNAVEPGRAIQRIKRKPVVTYHCRSPKAKDGNVARALVERFTPGAKNYGKGTKAAPGWFYGFKQDVWQAYALAVFTADMIDWEGAQSA